MAHRICRVYPNGPIRDSRVRRCLSRWQGRPGPLRHASSPIPKSATSRMDGAMRTMLSDVPEREVVFAPDMLPAAMECRNPPRLTRSACRATNPIGAPSLMCLQTKTFCSGGTGKDRKGQPQRRPCERYPRARPAWLKLRPRHRRLAAPSNLPECRATTNWRPRNQRLKRSSRPASVAINRCRVDFFADSGPAAESPSTPAAGRRAKTVEHPGGHVIKDRVHQLVGSPDMSNSG